VSGSPRLSQVQPPLVEALARWQASDVNTSTHGDIDLRIANFGGTTLGLASGHTVWVDDNATGWGSYVDKTPRNDSEFSRPNGQGEQNSMESPAKLKREVGRIQGYEQEEGGSMIDTRPAGTRKLPGSSVTLSDYSQLGLWWLTVAEELSGSKQEHNRSR